MSRYRLRRLLEQRGVKCIAVGEAPYVPLSEIKETIPELWRSLCSAISARRRDGRLSPDDGIVCADGIPRESRALSSGSTMKVVIFTRRVVSVAGTSVTSAASSAGRLGSLARRRRRLDRGVCSVARTQGISCPAPVLIVHGASIECADPVRTVTLDGIHGRDDVLASPASVKAMHVHVHGRPFDVQGITPRLQVVQRDVQVSTSNVLALPLDVQEEHAACTGCTLDVQGGRDAAIARTVGVLARTDDVRALRARFTKITARFTTNT